MSEPIPTDPVVDPDFPPEDPVPPEQEPVEPGPEMPVVGGWLDAAAQAGADAKQYTDEQVPLVAGRLVPRNMDRAPTVEDGTDLIAGTGWNQYDPTTSDLVQMWRWDGATWRALDMSAEMIPVLDIGSATVGDLTGGRINVQDGPIVAGDPTGARVELTGDGLHAYDATGTETARIQGEEGVFVGGEFRTSDTLTGQVTLADDAYINSTTGVAHPGIRVEPLDTSDMVRPPGIGPGDLGLYVDGGSDTSGRRSYMRASPTAALMRTFREDGTPAGEIQTSPTASFMRTHREDGTPAGEIAAFPTRSLMRTYSGNSSEQGWVRVQPQDAELAYVDPLNTYFSRIRATDTEAHLFTRAGGANRYLTVDADGIWVKTGAKSYNLEQTAQDSGWQAFSPVAGMDSYALAWRNKGGVIYMRGTVTASWQAGWTTVATGLPAEMRPAIRVVRQAPSTSEQGLYFRMGNDGVLEFNKPTAGTRTADLSAIFYPAD